MVEIYNKRKKLPQYRLFVKVIDKNKKPYITNEGVKLPYVKWVEVPEANLGSCKIPNENIKGFSFVPINEEGNEETDVKNIFKRFGFSF